MGLARLMFDGDEPESSAARVTVASPTLSISAACFCETVGNGAIALLVLWTPDSPPFP